MPALKPQFPWGVQVWGKGLQQGSGTSPPLHSSYHTDAAHTADSDMAWATIR